MDYMPDCYKKGFTNNHFPMESHLKRTQDEELNDFVVFDDCSREKKRTSYIRKNDWKKARIEPTTTYCIDESIDLVEVGKLVRMETFEDPNNILISSNINLTSLVGSLNTDSLVPFTLATIGSSTMMNSLSNEILMTHKRVNNYTTSHNFNLPDNLSSVELNVDNIEQGKNYRIEPIHQFLEFNLIDLFEHVKFRENASLLTKTKCLLKTYFLKCCHPSHCIWRYANRRSKIIQKKTIIDLPQQIKNVLLEFLVDLSGFGKYETSFDKLDKSSNFYKALGDNDSNRCLLYNKGRTMRESLKEYFMDKITDSLNEIRELSLSIKSGQLIRLYGKDKPSNKIIKWRDYEKLLMNNSSEPTDEFYIDLHELETLIKNNHQHFI